MTVKEIRLEKGLTQSQASELTGIPLRTYVNYENDAVKEGTIKYNYIAEKLAQYGFVDETHGIIDSGSLQRKCSDIFRMYDVDFAILFGSYARGNANENSDIDLVISTTVSGLKFFGIAEELRKATKKNIDLLNIDQLNNNPALLKNVLKEGKRIYVQGQ